MNAGTLAAPNCASPRSLQRVKQRRPTTWRSCTWAAHWYREAANHGDVGAQYILGSMYEKGDGVSADLRLARYWYAAAARQGDEAAPAKLKDIDARLTAQ